MIFSIDDRWRNGRGKDWTPNYDDWYADANNMGLYGEFSAADRALAQQNPYAGYGILWSKYDYANAADDEGRTMANNNANWWRSNAGGYTAGSDGNQYQASAPWAMAATNTLDKIGNYGPFQYGRDADYQAALDRVLNPAQFSYDLESDPSYQALRTQAQREGTRAMKDTLGQVSARTGGLASSYGVSAAAQANNYYLEKLNDQIPALYNNAYTRYLNERNLEQTALNALRNDRSDEYGMYGDEYNKLLDVYGLQSDKETTLYNRAKEQEQTEYERAQDQWEKDYKIAKENKDYALKMAEKYPDHAGEFLQAAFSDILPAGIDLSKLDAEAAAKLAQEDQRSVLLSLIQYYPEKAGALLQQALGDMLPEGMDLTKWDAEKLAEELSEQEKRDLLTIAQAYPELAEQIFGILYGGTMESYGLTLPEPTAAQPETAAAGLPAPAETALTGTTEQGTGVADILPPPGQTRDLDPHSEEYNNIVNAAIENGSSLPPFPTDVNYNNVTDWLAAVGVPMNGWIDTMMKESDWNRPDNPYRNAFDSYQEYIRKYSMYLYEEYTNAGKPSGK